MTQSEASSHSFALQLEGRLHKQTEELEEVHLDAAIDAQLTTVVTPSSACVISVPGQETNSGTMRRIGPPQNNGDNQENESSSPIFDDYTSKFFAGLLQFHDFCFYCKRC